MFKVSDFKANAIPLGEAFFVAFVAFCIDFFVTLTWPLYFPFEVRTGSDVFYVSQLLIIPLFLFYFFKRKVIYFSTSKLKLIALILPICVGVVFFLLEWAGQYFFEDYIKKYSLLKSSLELKAIYIPISIMNSLLSTVFVCGLFLPALVKKCGAYRGLFLLALFYAIFSLNLVYFPVNLLWVLILGFLYFKADSLWPPLATTFAWKGLWVTYWLLTN